MEGRGGKLHLSQGLEVVVLARLLPLLAALFENPHAGDVLEETCRALNAAFVGEVQFCRTVCDDGVSGLNTHERPRARRQVGEFLVFGRNGGDSRAGIVAGNGDYGDVVFEGSNLLLQVAYHLARHDDGREAVDIGSGGLDEFAVNLFGHGIEELRCREDGVFTHLLAREEVADVVGDEEIGLGFQHRLKALFVACVELEQRVEVEELDTRLLIDRLAGDDAGVFRNRRVGIGIAVSTGFADCLALPVEEYDIHAPGIDTDGLDPDIIFACQFIQAGLDFSEQSLQTPIKLAVLLLDGIWEPAHFLCFEYPVDEACENEASACGTEVDS